MLVVLILYPSGLQQVRAGHAGAKKVPSKAKAAERAGTRCRDVQMDVVTRAHVHSTITAKKHKIIIVIIRNDE